MTKCHICGKSSKETEIFFMSMGHDIPSGAEVLEIKVRNWVERKIDKKIQLFPYLCYEHKKQALDYIRDYDK